MTEKNLEKRNDISLPVWARIVLIIISYLILSTIFQIIGMLMANISITDKKVLENLSLNQLLIVQPFGFIALIIIVYIFRKFIDEKSIRSIGFSLINRINDIIAGFIIALSIIGGGSLILYILGYIDFSNIQFDLQSLLLSFCLFIIVSLNEEILIRGYILNNLLTTMNKYFALIISAIIFTLFHSFNSDLSLIGIINLFLAGMLLGSTYIFTKNLWFPISLHLFWNFLQGPVLGYSVSGQKIDSLLKLKRIGNETINGGEFGFEGSIICTVITIVSIIIIMTYYNKKPARADLQSVPLTENL